MNQQDKAAPTAPPVAAPGASIDTPEFRNLLQDHRTEPESASKKIRLLAHIDAAMDRTARDKDGNHVDDLRVWLDESQAALENANTALWSTSLKLQEAEASLARLVEGWKELRPRTVLAKGEGWITYLDAEKVLALLPAKADKPGTPARTTADVAYEAMTPEQRRAFDQQMMDLQARIQSHQRDKERRKLAVPVAVEQRVGDRRKG